MHSYTEQIQRWEEKLDSGDWVSCGPSELDKSIIVTLARKQRGRLPGDPLGPEAERLIND